jgi:hypothetical protein
LSAAEAIKEPSGDIAVALIIALCPEKFLRNLAFGH